MTGQDDFNNNWQIYCLYYLGYTMGDPTVYPIDASTICAAAFDGDNNIYFSAWFASSPEPAISSLVAYNLSDVQTWYASFYTYPAAIIAQEPLELTTAQIALLRTSDEIIGMVVFDTDIRDIKRWDGTSWVVESTRYLKRDGDSMLGDIDMKSHNIIGAADVITTSPACLSSGTSSTSSMSQSFTTGTSLLVSASSSAKTTDPASAFTVNASTGQVTYNGDSTRYFRVSANWSVDAPVVGSTMTLSNYISKNGSLTLPSEKSSVTFIPSGPALRTSGQIDDIVQLSKNDNVQLGAQSSATISVNYYNLGYCITPA